MKVYAQATIRLPQEKAELINQIRQEKNMSWSAIAEMAFDKFLETHTVKQDLTDAEIVAKKEDPEIVKPLNNEEKTGQETGQFSLDMSKLKLSLGEEDGNTF
jgi:hypothetical protein